MSRVEFGRQDAHPTHKITLFPIAGGVGKIETDTLHAVVVALRWLAGLCCEQLLCVTTSSWEMATKTIQTLNMCTVHSYGER